MVVEEKRKGHNEVEEFVGVYDICDTFEKKKKSYNLRGGYKNT
jgi:hypothetical protein